MMYGLANASRYGMENSWFFQPKSCCISETYMAIMPSILLTEITSAYALSNRVISDEHLVDFARPSWPTNVAVAVSDMLLVSSSFVCGWLITATNCIMDGMSNTNFQRFHGVQNAAAWIVCQAPRRQHHSADLCSAVRTPCNLPRPRHAWTTSMKSLPRFSYVVTTSLQSLLRPY